MEKREYVQLEKVYLKWTDDDLVRAATVDKNDYDPKAIEVRWFSDLNRSWVYALSCFGISVSRDHKLTTTTHVRNKLAFNPGQSSNVVTNFSTIS